MKDITLPTAITEAIDAYRSEAAYGCNARDEAERRAALESTLAPWLAIVREVAEMDPYDRNAYREPCLFCRRAELVDTERGDAREPHAPTCLHLRSRTLTGAR